MTICCSFSLAAFAQEGGGHFVQEVRIQGVQRVPESTIRSNIQTQAGRIANREQLNADIRRLFKLGYFQDIQVEQERGAHGMIVTFVVIEKAVINKLVITGNHKIKAPAIREVVTVPLYQTLNEKRLAESVVAIKNLYAKKNYYSVDVSWRVETTPEGEYELVLDIREYPMAVIRQVQFVGNTVFTDDELRKQIRTKKKGTLSFMTGTGHYKEEDLKQDVLRLTFHYLKNGYLKVRVENPKVSLTKDKRYFFVTFHLEEGDRYRIGKVGVAGDILTTREELISKLQTKPGQIYNRELIEKDMQELTKLYGNQGYAFVNIQPVTDTDEVAKTADIIYTIEKGPRIFIERIEISGNTTTRDKVIRREMKVKEGDVYSESEIEQSRQKIAALGFFKEVNFATPRGARDDMLVLKISVEEKPTGSFSVGAGFSTTEDFILSGSISKQNFFGRGWNGEISAEASSRRQQFLLNMTDPYFFDSEWIVGMSAFKTAYRFTDFNRDSYGGSFSIGHRFFDNMSVSLGYEAEEVDATDFQTFVPASFREDASGLTSLVSFTLNRDTRDNRIYASKGMFNQAKMEVSGSKLGGSNNFWRASGKVQFYQPVVDQLVFKTYLRIGYIKSMDDGIVPLFERYFLGGVNTLRGFYPLSIGPSEIVPGPLGTPVTFVFGGDKMMVINAELEYPIIPSLGLKGVGFFDAGNAYGEGSNFSFEEIRMDWGFGLRWVSPMGPLRFEWGFPIDRQPGEQKTVFNFTIGHFF
ncbi:MAG: outer membrane protein assembly factor BamA [Deltaproteobacteria bacterium]|nr:outer membrane protein assembly factor BamA [Deltaproteobacteria bacterium]